MSTDTTAPALNGHQADRIMVRFGPSETEEFNLQLASDVLTIVKRDFPQTFAVAAARAWGIELAMPRGGK
jgi:hypothetical protein